MKDLHVGFLFVNYVMERSREEMLRSYFMYRVDSNGDGLWSYAERKAVIERLNNKEHHTQSHLLDNNTTLPRSRSLLLKKTTAGREGSKNTAYLWSSEFGYPFIKKSITSFDFWRMKDRPSEIPCDIPPAECFGSDWLKPSVDTIPVDTNRLFEGRDLSCGDCILSRLGGLSEILPKDDNTNNKILYNSVRALISRYNFVIGESPLAFVSVRNLADLSKIRKRKAIMFCINNDISLSSLQGLERVRGALHDLLGSQFPHKSPCEK